MHSRQPAPSTPGGCSGHCQPRLTPGGWKPGQAKQDLIVHLHVDTSSPTGLNCLSLVLIRTVSYTKKKGGGGFSQLLPKKFGWLGRAYLTNGGPQRRKS